MEKRHLTHPQMVATICGWVRWAPKADLGAGRPLRGPAFNDGASVRRHLLSWPPFKQKIMFPTSSLLPEPRSVAYSTLDLAIVSQGNIIWQTLHHSLALAKAAKAAHYPRTGWHLAAWLGLPYAFASHFVSTYLHEALRIYHAEFSAFGRAATTLCHRR